MIWIERNNWFIKVRSKIIDLNWSFDEFDNMYWKEKVNKYPNWNDLNSFFFQLIFINQITRNNQILFFISLFYSFILRFWFQSVCYYFIILYWFHILLLPFIIILITFFIDILLLYYYTWFSIDIQSFYNL